MYYIIRFLGRQNKGLSPVYAIPGPWIRWQEEKVETVVVAYPEEPWVVTMERVKGYENPQRIWDSFLARIEGCSDNYSPMIRSINEREHVEISTPGLETPQPGPSHSSTLLKIEVPFKITPTEFKKWVSGHPSPLNENPFQIRTIENFATLQYLVEKAEEEINSEENRVDETMETQTRNFDHSSKFTELTPNSGVYIETSELEIYLMISGVDHTAQYWCFIRKGDTAPNPANYFYRGNLITNIFPHLTEEYSFHERRRELAKEMEAFTEFDIDLIENDEGIDLCDRKEYLEDTKELLQYHIIMPETLFNAPNIKQEVVDKLRCKLDQVIKDGKHLQLAVLTIGDHEVILKICNEKLYWWFSLPHHKVPNAEEYFFAHGLLEKLFPMNEEKFGRTYL